jgi:phosphoglycolate phosphatase
MEASMTEPSRLGATRFRAVIFDLDGTLVHTAPDIHAATLVMLADLDRPLLSLEQVTSFVGHGVERLVVRCLEATGGHDASELRQARAIFNRAYSERPADFSRLNPGVLDLLRDLSLDGVRLGVCTNKPQALTEALLGRTGIAPLMAAVVGGDVVALKPNPASLLLCQSRLGSAYEACLFVGDSEVDGQTAEAAGVPFALFTGGYSQVPPEQIKAEARFDDFSVLSDLLRRARRPRGDLYSMP